MRELDYKTELLNKQFNNVFITDDSNTTSLFYSNILSNISEMVDLDITVGILLKANCSLKLLIFNTPDQIPALFLRKTTFSLSLIATF